MDWWILARVSTTNVEIVREVFEAFQAGMGRGDVGAAFDTGRFVDDAEWVPAPEIPGPASYRGREGFVEFMRVWTEDFEHWSVELERMVDVGDDRVLLLAHQTGVGKGSGVPVELHFAQVYELSDGRIVRIRNHVHPAEALEAVGMSE